MTDKKSTVNNSYNNRIIGWILAAIVLTQIIFCFLPIPQPGYVVRILAGIAAAAFSYMNISAKSDVDNWVGSGGVILALAIIGIYAGNAH